MNIHPGSVVCRLVCNLPRALDSEIKIFFVTRHGYFRNVIAGGIIGKQTHSVRARMGTKDIFACKIGIPGSLVPNDILRILTEKA